MPVYSYRCGECGSEFERQLGLSEPPLTTCPVCGKDALRKIFTPVGIVFKGSGFYSTDHRGSSARSGSSNGKGETKADTGTEAKPETKPAPPTPPKED